MWQATRPSSRPHCGFDVEDGDSLSCAQTGGQLHRAQSGDIFISLFKIVLVASVTFAGIYFHCNRTAN